MKPAIYFPIAHPLYLESVRPIMMEIYACGLELGHHYKGQPIMIGSDAGDACAAQLCFNLNHGFGSKHLYWGAGSADRERVTIQLVPSKWYARMLERYGVQTIVVGMPRLDWAFWQRQHCTGKVLYAPTCHTDITSVNMVQRKIYDIEHFEPVVRYHPQLKVQVPQVQEWYPDWVSNKDAGMLVAEADVVICD